MKKNYLKNIISILRCNILTLLKFEIIYKLLISLIFIPFGLLGFNVVMKITGNTLLTMTNLKSFLLNPLTILFIIILIIFFTLINIFEISTLIIIFNESYHNKKIIMKDAIKISYKKCKQLFNIKNIMVCFFLMFLIPFFHFAISSNIISSIKLPEFIMDYINSNILYITIYSIIYILLFIIFFKWLYSIHYMILEDKDFKEARKNSGNLIKNSFIKDFLKILLAQLFFTIIYLLLLLIGVGIVILIKNVLANYNIIQSFLITIIWLLMGLVLIGYGILSNAISYAIISSLFYKHKNQKNEEIIELKYKNSINNKLDFRPLKIISIIMFILAIIGGSLITYQVIIGNINMSLDFDRNIEVTAHRGYSVKYPENTLSAFKGAHDVGATWIELDVQQTRDKKIIISHDGNLKRTANVDKKIIDMTYDEIKDLDVGSFFSEEFKGEKIPLLSEAIKFAKENDMKLNIELKPNGKEIDFEKSVIDIINEYDFKDNCVIASFNYNVLTKVKEIDPNIKTAYLMSIAIGNVLDANYADVYSIEASSISDNLVSKIHNANKEVYAWTINTEESINNMIEKNVDNIITDNIELGLELIEVSKHSDLINEFFKLIESNIK